MLSPVSDVSHNTGLYIRTYYNDFAIDKLIVNSPALARRVSAASVWVWPGQRADCGTVGESLRPRLLLIWSHWMRWQQRT